MSQDDFSQNRDLLIGVAYRVLGSHSDAEDVVQEAWLRWSRVDRSQVDSPQAYLVTITTRLAIDQLRKAQARRETYAGPWLPEPVTTSSDLAEHAALAESVDLAVLVVLESLSPLERAVFVLREAFDLPFAEIAQIVEREEAATRQLAKRAREHVGSRSSRYEVDRVTRRRLTERFLAACAGGELSGLAELLADDVRLVPDSGGKARAPLRVLEGADKVARFLLGISTPRGMKAFLASIDTGEEAEIGMDVIDVNGAPTAVITADGRLITVASLVVVDGRISEIMLLANPEKLSGRALAR